MGFITAASVVRFSLKRGKYEGGTMNQKTAPAPLKVFVCFIVLIIGASPVPAFDVVTIVGEVNDANQIISDGDIYEVDDTMKGDDLGKNYIGQKVKVTGKMRIEGDMRILDVTKIEVVKD
jgi:hypothetical protein